MIIFCLVVFTTLVLAVTFANRAQFGTTTKAKHLVRRSLFIASAIAAMVTAGVFIAQRVSATSSNNLGQVPVGTTEAAQSITVHGPDGNTVDSVQVFSQTVAPPATPDYVDQGTGTCQPGFTFSSSNGDSCTVIVNFTPQAVGQRNGAVQIFHAGAVEGTIYITGTGTAPQIALTPGTITSPVTFGPGVIVQGGVIDAAGKQFVDTHGSTIYSISGGTATFFAGVAPGYVDGSTAVAEFSDPHGMAIDGQGAIYVADTTNSAIRKISAGNVTTIAGGPSASGGDGGLAINASLNGPTAVAVDAAGHVFIADNGSFRIRRIDAISGIITTVAGNGTNGFAGDGGLGNDPAAEIGTVGGLALDASGNLFFTDSDHQVIRELDTAQKLHTYGGTANSSGHAGDGGSALSATLNGPSGIAVDASGSVYFSDSNNSAVRRIDVAGNISTVAGTINTPGSGGDNGPATAAVLTNPTGLVMNAQANFFIIDNAGTTVRLVDVSAAPSITFPDTQILKNSAKQTIRVENTGNTALTFSSLTIAGHFTLDASSTCTTSGSVAAGGSCSLVLEASPATVGANNGSLTITSNSLNGTPSTVINLLNNGAAPPTQLAFGTTPATPIAAGGNPGSAITVLEQDGGGTTVTTANDLITLTVTGPAPFTKTATAASGVATFDLSATQLNLVGTYGYTATTSTLTSPTVNEVVTAGPAAKFVVSTITPPVATGNLGTITATIQDANGNTVTTSAAAVTISITGPAGFSFTPLTVNAASGVASFDLTSTPLNYGGSYTVTFTSAGLTGPAPTTFTVTGGTPVSISAPTPPLPAPNSVFAGSNNLSPVQVNLLDSNNNVAVTSSDVIKVVVTGPGSYSQSISQPAAKGVATLDLSSLPVFTTVGTYTVTFSDATKPSVTPNTGTFVVNPGAAAKTIAGAVPATLTAGGNVGNVTITVQDANGNTVTGFSGPATVTVTGPAGPSSTVLTFSGTLTNGTGTITASTALNTAGTYSVVATADGFSSTPQTVTVNPGAAAKTIASAVPATLISGGNVGNVTVTVQDANGNTVTGFSGPATVTVTGPAPSTVLTFNGTLNGGTGTIAANTALNTAGTYSVVANADGFSSTAQTVTVTAGAASKIAVTVPNVPAGSTLGTLTATIEDAAGNTVTTSTAVVTGTVTGPNGYSQTVPSTTAANGVANIDMSHLPVFNIAGTYSITLNATGGLTITKPFTVTAGAASKLTVAPFTTSITAGGNLGTISVNVVDAFGNTVTTSTAPVTVGITGPGGFTFTSAPVNAVNGVATISVAGTALNTAGAYSVTAASPTLTSPPAIPVTVTAQTTAGFVVVSGFPASISTGGSGAAMVTVQDAFHNTSTGFTGTVTLTSSDPNAVFTPASYTYTNADAGVHAFTVMLNTAGTQSITATTGGVSGSQTAIVVGKVTTTATLALTPGGTGASYGVAQSLTATIAPATAGSTSAGGTVQFKDNGAALGAPVAVTGGAATLNLMFPVAGNHSYTALYSGDADFAATTSNTVPFLVTQSATTTTVTSSTTPAAQGDKVTFTATVVGSAGGTPTGTVSFFDATTLLGASNLGASGTATLATTFVTLGTHSITAVYGGDANFSGSTSTAFSQAVSAAFTLTLNPASLNLKRGDNGHVAVTLTANGSFTGIVNLTCSGLPSTMECIFLPSTINATPAGSAQTIELLLKTRGVFTKPTAMLQGNGTGNSDAPVFPALAFWVPGAALSAFGLRRKGMNGRKRQALLLVVLMLGMGGLLGLAGCGSGTGPTTPAGTYNFTVTATSGTLVNSAPLTVVIQ